jgi:ABC-2 type transport system permease protein
MSERSERTITEQVEQATDTETVPAVRRSGRGHGMRAFNSLAGAMLKGFMRDRMSLFFTIFFPLFFIIIFGTVFSGAGQSKVKVIEVGPVPLIDTMPADARAAFDQIVELQTSTDPDAADAAVQQAGNTLQLHYSAADQVQAATVQGVFAGFVDQANIAVTGAPPTYTLDSQQVEDESLQAIQYVTPGMIAYGIAVGATFGAAMTLVTWRKTKLLRRLRLAPVATSTVVGSRVVVSLGVALVQLVIFIGVAMLPFLGLKLSGAWYMAVPLTLAGALAFLSIGLFVGAIAKTEEGAAGLANLITLPMAFLSGAFIPLETAPAWLAATAKVLPMGWLVQGLTDVLVRGQGPQAALLPILILLVFAAVVTAIAARLFKWDTT